MDRDAPLTPYTPWSQEEADARIAELPGMETQDLRSLVECLSEDVVGAPSNMRAHYEAARAELARRV